MIRKMEPVEPVTPPQPVCLFCGIHDDEPKTTFTCQHTAHTACFLQLVANDIVRCPTCDTVVYAYTYIPRGTPEITEIQKIYSEDFDFKKNVVAYVRSLREVSRADKLLKKFMKERKSIYIDEIQMMKDRLSEIKRYEIKRLKTSSQFKNFQKCERKKSRLLSNLHPTKHFSARDLMRALKGKPKLKSWPFKWRSPRRGDLYRYFYYRINI